MVPDQACHSAERRNSRKAPKRRAGPVDRFRDGGEACFCAHIDIFDVEIEESLFVEIEIDAELIRLDATEDRPHAAQMATERLAALEEKIAELEAARTALSRLRTMCGSDRKGPCPILEAFDPD